MADAKWLKREPLTEQQADDPFAELTRIMGFDPRVPFRSQQQTTGQPVAAPQQVSAPNVDVSDDDLDFAIDLEQELMGALAGDAPRSVAEAQPAAEQFRQTPAAATPARAEPALDEQAYGDFDLDDEIESVAAEPRGQAEFSPFAPRQLAYREEPQAELGDEDDAAYAFDDAVRASEEDVYAPDEQSGAGYYAADDADLDDGGYDADDRQSPVRYAQGDQGGEDDHSAALAAELDDALGASFENELAYDDDTWDAADHSPAVNAASAPAATAQADEPAGDFDTAMAEVDMDFSATSRQAGEYETPEQPVYQAFEDDLEASLAREFDDEPMTTHAESAVYEAEDEEPAPRFPHGVHFDDGDVTDEVAEPEAAEAGNDIDDAIAELAAMVRSYDPPTSSQPNNLDTPMPAVQRMPAEDTPDIETVDVPEDAIALADDLDLPEVDYSEDPAPAFDDLDAELAAAFGEPQIETVQPAKPSEPIAMPFDLDGGYDARIGAAGAAAIAAGGGLAARQAFAQGGRPGQVQLERRAPASAYGQRDEDFDVDPDLEDDLDLAGELAAGQKARSPRKGLLIASVVGGIAVLGVIGAFAFSGGGGVSGEPALVKADTDPVKVKPENPGGLVVPNQESQVFDRAAGGEAGQAQQQTLISNEEEPVDMAARFPEELPQPIDDSADIDEAAAASPKDEDRIEQAAVGDADAAAEPTVAVEPRKVRTMVVKSDGTLVPREETAPAAEAAETTAAGSLTDPTISSPQPADAQASAEAKPAAQTLDDVAATAPAPTAGEPRTTNSTTPSQVPVAPSRPAEQPLDIVGEVKADKVAALDPAAAAPAPGSWSMQIASQPSEAAAQSSYQDLARRYAKVLGGRSASIVKAEIAGKGTFWRVRVPAGSRNEAISLCESYKAAGGNCFVSK